MALNHAVRAWIHHDLIIPAMQMFFRMNFFIAGIDGGCIENSQFHFDRVTLPSSIHAIFKYYRLSRDVVT